MDLNQTNEPRFTDEEMAEVDRLQSDPSSEYYYNDPDESFMERLKRKLAPYGEDFKGFVEYLFTPSRHFGTGQYNEGGVAEQMEMFGYTAEGAQQEADKFVEEAGDLETDISKAASFVVPFYDSGVNIANVAQEYMKPEQERDYEYIKDQFREAGQSAAIEGGLLLMGGVAGKYGAKGIKALADKIKQYEIDPTAMSAFGAGAIRKKSKEQISNKEYDAQVTRLDEQKDVDSWQTEAKKLVKKERKINPDIKTPELENSTRLLLENKITREEHLKNVDKYKPVSSWDNLPREPSDKALVFALDSNKRENGLFVLANNIASKLGVSPSSLKIGDLFNGRLDIPAYLRHDTWIVAGTSPAVRTADNKGVTTYAKAIHYGGGDKPVRFIASSKQSEAIGTGDANKTGYATVSGIVKDLDEKNIRAKAAEYLNDPEWTQVGFDPRRQGGFYVRAGENKHVPVREASEVIQIGPLVLAKNAKLDMDYKGYNEGGVAMNDQMEMAFMQEGGIIDDDLDVDPVSGNEVPPGSLAEEVRDDIPAQLSEGEYVVPADVVRYYGVKFFEDLRDQAKMGLAEMEANGRIGGEPVPEGGPINDQELSEQEMAAIKEVMGMAEGGTIQNPYLQQQQMYSQPAPQAVGNTIGYSGGGQVQGYQAGNPVVSTPVSSQPDAPSYAQNTFNPMQYGLGFSFMGGQPQQQPPVADNPNVPEIMTLYGPNGEIRTFNMPLSEADAAEVARLKELGYSETKAVTTTPVTGGGGGGSSRPPVETDPNEWMENFDYTDMGNLGSQTSDLLKKAPVGSVMGAFMNATTAAQAAANLIILKNNGGDPEEIAKLQAQYDQFIKDSKLGYMPKGLINGDRLAKDIVLNNPGKDIALDRNSVDVNNKPLFKDDNDFNKFMQKTAPEGMTFDPDAKYKTTDDSGKSVEVGSFKRKGSAAPTKSLRPIGRPARPADKTPIAIPTGRESVPVGSLPAAAPKSAEDARAESRKASKNRRKYQKANRDRSRNKASSKDRVKDYKSGGQKFRGQGGRAEGGLMKKGDK